MALWIAMLLLGILKRSAKNVALVPCIGEKSSDIFRYLQVISDDFRCPYIYIIIYIYIRVYLYIPLFLNPMEPPKSWFQIVKMCSYIPQLPYDTTSPWFYTPQDGLLQFWCQDQGEALLTQTADGEDKHVDRGWWGAFGLGKL